MDIVSPITSKRNDNGKQDVSTTASTNKYCLGREQVNDIITGICPHNQTSSKDMNSNVDRGSSGNSKQYISHCGSSPTSFDSAAAYVARILETNYYIDFLQSHFYAKYQVSLI